MFLLVLACLGCPGQTAVKWLLLLLLSVQFQTMMTQSMKLATTALLMSMWSPTLETMLISLLSSSAGTSTTERPLSIYRRERTMTSSMLIPVARYSIQVVPSWQVFNPSCSRSAGIQSKLFQVGRYSIQVVPGRQVFSSSCSELAGTQSKLFQVGRYSVQVIWHLAWLAHSVSAALLCLSCLPLQNFSSCCMPLQQLCPTQYPHPPHTHLFNGPVSGTTWVSQYHVKPIWILLKQETVSGSDISWAICKSAPCSRQITTPAPHHSVFYRLDALPAAQPT